MYLIVLAVARILPDFILLALCGLLALLAVAALALRSLPHRAMCTALLLTGAVGCGAMALFNLSFVRPVTALDQQTTILTGTVVSEPVFHQNAFTCTVRVDALAIDEAPAGFLLCLTGFSPELIEPYDQIRAEVVFSLPEGSGSYLAGQQAAGIWLDALSYHPVYVQGSGRDALDAQFFLFRQRLSKEIARLLPSDAGGLVRAVALGDRSGLSDATSEAFRLTGASHLLALSGLHLSLLATAVVGLGKAFAFPRKICYTISIAVALAYMALTGFGFSVLRAGIMLVIFDLAQILYRDADAFTSLGVAAGLICLCNPYAASDIGLQLSFATTGGILLFSGRLSQPLLRRLPKRSWLRPVRGVIESLAVSCAAGIAAFPLTVLYFGNVSLAGPVATLLAAPLMPLVMLGGLLAGLFGVWGWTPVAYCAAFVAGLAARLLIWALTLLSALPFVSVYLRMPYVLVWTGGTALGCVLLRRPEARRYRPLFLLFSLSVLLSAALLQLWVLRDVVQVSVIDGVEASGAAVTVDGSTLYIGDTTDRNTAFWASVCAGNQAELGVLLGPTQLDALQQRLRTDDLFVYEPFAPSSDVSPVQIFGRGRTRLQLTKGTLSLPAGAQACALYELGSVQVLVLPDGYDVLELPAAYLRPDLLVLCGKADNLSLLRPRYAFVLGGGYEARLTLLAGQTDILNAASGERRLYTALLRYGDDLLLTSEPV